jgi:hypothetical protein
MDGNSVVRLGGALWPGHHEVGILIRGVTSASDGSRESILHYQRMKTLQRSATTGEQLLPLACELMQPGTEGWAKILQELEAPTFSAEQTKPKTAGYEAIVDVDDATQFQTEKDVIIAIAKLFPLRNQDKIPTHLIKVINNPELTTENSSDVEKVKHEVEYHEKEVAGTVWAVNNWKEVVAEMAKCQSKAGTAAFAALRKRVWDLLRSIKLILTLMEVRRF